MTAVDIAFIWLAIALVFTVGIAVGHSLARSSKVKPEPPTQLVVKRTIRQENEHVVVEDLTLECGHSLRTRSYRRTTWPCTECERALTERAEARVQGS